jgi:hypothetical protein
MRKIVGYGVVLAILALGWSAGAAAPPQKTKASAKKTGASVSKQSGAPAKKSTTTAARKGGKKAAPRATWRNRQLQPTPDRYKTIQDALAAKGYMKAEDATGKWDQGSMDALKKFQEDQKIESTGKINSLSLIALGLGPKHEVAALPAPPPKAEDK